MCNGSIHRSLGGLVDPFSTFHLLRTYNRLVGPVDLAQYYNLAVIKDAKERSHVFPVTTTKPVNSPPLLRRDIDNCINQRSFLNQSPNRIVSSTCPPTPPPPQSLTNSSVITDDPGGTADTGGNNIISFDHTLNGYSSRGDASSDESFQCILNRRQRGEKRPIPDEQKDDKYFERRKRNNEAAKKSRDARKMREDRIAFRAAVLEQENAILRTQMVALRDEVSTLRQMMCTRGPINVN